MKFRRNCFSIVALAVLALGILWIAAGVSESDTPTESEAEEVGQTIGQSIGVTLILCITLPLTLFFALLAWRNSVGMATERRHQEHIAALRQMPPQR